MAEAFPRPFRVLVLGGFLLLLPGCLDGPSTGALPVSLVGNGNLSGPLPATCFALASEAAQARCLEAAIENMVRAGKTRDALGEVSNLTAAGTIDDCHFLAHAIGAAVYHLRHDLLAAMKEGSDACAGGYYHGVVIENMTEEAAEGRVPSHLRSLCAATLVLGEQVEMECIHGVGHGLYLTQSANATHAVDGCTAFRIPAQSSYCVDGVFMEYAMGQADAVGSTGSWSLPSACFARDLWYGNAVDCGENVGEIAAIRAHHNLGDAWPRCEMIDNRTIATACEAGVVHEMEIQAQERGFASDAFDQAYWKGRADVTVADQTTANPDAQAFECTGCGGAPIVLQPGAIVGPETAEVLVVLWHNMTIPGEVRDEANGLPGPESIGLPSRLQNDSGGNPPSPLFAPTLSWSVNGSPTQFSEWAQNARGPTEYVWPINVTSEMWDRIGARASTWSLEIRWTGPAGVSDTRVGQNSEPEPPGTDHIYVVAERPDALLN
ncbi:MAG: hypothetical protein ACYDDF_13930 [Thermoplasmatota archaeon]